jgi:hypothetical protein
MLALRYKSVTKHTGSARNTTGAEHWLESATPCAMTSKRSAGVPPVNRGSRCCAYLKLFRSTPCCANLDSQESRYAQTGRVRPQVFPYTRASNRTHRKVYMLSPTDSTMFSPIRSTGDGEWQVVIVIVIRFESDDAHRSSVVNPHLHAPLRRRYDRYENAHFSLSSHLAITANA